MTYSEAVDYILDIPKFTKKNDAAHTKAFLKTLGDPQRKMRIIHVAGTNGKGSVCAYLDGMLRSEQKRTGLFTSPHLVKINERIVIDGQMISDERFLEVFEETMQAVDKMKEAGLSHPTFFEFLFGMAVLAFAESGVEYAVLETGLGGRLDATNAVESPAASVITSIGFDHEQYLGDTLEKIASEKAGIIKPHVPVYYAQTTGESDSVIEKEAKKRGSFCKKIGKDAYEILGIEDKHIAFSCLNDYYGTTCFKIIYDYLSTHSDDDKYRYCMVGYQLKNTVTENGSVARGVCTTDADSNLISVVEHTQIEQHEGGIRFTEDKGETWHEIDGNTIVSMNLWGFSESFIKEAKDRFAAFLDDAMVNNPLKGEYFLPSVVSQLLDEDKASVKVLQSPDKWYGVTYREDKPGIVKALADKAADGLYPTPLWQ